MRMGFMMYRGAQGLRVLGNGVHDYQGMQSTRVRGNGVHGVLGCTGHQGVWEWGVQFIGVYGR